MKKSNRIILICICSLLIISILIGICFLMFKSCENNKAHADYSDIVLNPNSIVNFNQLINITYSNSNVYGLNINIKNQEFVVSGTANASNQMTLMSTILTGGHYYYLRGGYSNNFYIVFTGANVLSNRFDYGNGTIVYCSTTTTTNLLFQYVNGATSNFTTYFQLTDLTTMFGSGNEPNIDECKDLFIADYYSYNTGETMSLNGLNAYNKALQDIFSSYTYQLSMNALSNATYSVDYNNESSNFAYDSTNQGWYFLNTFGVPLYTSISSGSKININYWFYAPNFEGNYYLNIMYYTGDGYSTLYTDTQKINTSEGNSVTFTLPISVNTLYFNIVHNNNVWTGGNMLVFKFDISASQLDITQAIQNAYQSGFNDYVNTLKEGNSVYDAIFQRGYNACADGQAVFSDSWAFLGSVFNGLGDLLSVEFFPNLPIGLFVALPLLLGLIFFIVKLTKGG